MATPLRYALTTLCSAGMLIVYLPLFAAAGFLRPAFSTDSWRLLFDDPQLVQALAATLVSTLIAVGGALALTLLIIAALWPSAGWQRLTARLPLLLALPHVAFATGALLMFAEGGLFYRALPFLHAAPDPYGIGLGLVLAVKECGFLLWVSGSALGEKRYSEQLIVLRSLGYGRLQCLRHLLLPRLLPALGIALLATAAWTISAVDVAIILGPGNPPTMAVLAWQWLNQGDEPSHIKGQLACALLLALLAALSLAARLLWRAWQTCFPGLHGRRAPSSTLVSGKIAGHFVPLSGLLCAAMLLLLAYSALPDSLIFNNSLWLALLASLAGAALCLLWLEWGPAWLTRCLWLPLLLPALPLAAGQYEIALFGWLDGQFSTVLWGHLLWVIPWMLFVLRPAWQQIDPRLILIARSLGWPQARIFLRIKCPLIIKPLLAALAIGFSVSIAQYLPTQWLGAGRIPTFTTEAVALSSGGATPQLAAQGLWQLLLPAIFFLLTVLLTRLIGHFRQGLR